MALDEQDLTMIRMLIQAQTNQIRTAIPTVLLRPGSVESFASVEQVAQVLVDGDDTVAVPVQNITGFTLTAGQRVMVLFQQPHGAFVIGLAAPP